MKFILGKKQEMSQIYRDDKVVPVTVIKVDSCKVTQIKNKEKDGYNSVQIGCGSKKKINKPLKGHLKNESFKYLKEFRLDGQALNIGDVLDLTSFESGDKIKITGVSKGKGFQGVVRRHGFKGQPTSHGTKDQVRMSGSIGATGPAHVFKGTRMGGQMGNVQVTVSNLEVVEVDRENNLIKIKGAVPGHRNSLVALEGQGEMRIEEVKKEVEPKKEDENEEKKQEEAREEMKDAENGEEKTN